MEVAVLKQIIRDHGHDLKLGLSSGTKVVGFVQEVRSTTTIVKAAANKTVYVVTTAIETAEHTAND